MDAKVSGSEWCMATGCIPNELTMTISPLAPAFVPREFILILVGVRWLGLLLLVFGFGRCVSTAPMFTGIWLLISCSPYHLMSLFAMRFTHMSIVSLHKRMLEELIRSEYAMGFWYTAALHVYRGRNTHVSNEEWLDGQQWECSLDAQAPSQLVPVATPRPDMTLRLDI
jgi:hypothetical protein